VMRRCRCELSMSLPVYFCGPPAAQHSISLTALHVASLPWQLAQQLLSNAYDVVFTVI
jgi:hypothetical protein